MRAHCEQNKSKLVYVVNIVFLPTKFLDLSGFKILLSLKKCTQSVYLVKDSHMKYTFHPDKDSSYLTSYTQDI